MFTLQLATIHSLSIAAAVLLALYLVVRYRHHAIVWRAIGLLLIAGLLVYGFGAFELPHIKTLLSKIGPALGAWTYPIVGLSAFLETAAFIGLVFPGETVVIVGGLVAGQGKINLFALIAVVWLCAILGDITAFVLGRRLGRTFLRRHGRLIRLSDELLDRVDRVFERWGGWAVLVGRFITFVRAITPFIAGSTRLRFRRFILFDILATCLWSIELCLIGFIFWRSIDKAETYLDDGLLILAGVIVVIALVAYGIHIRRSPKARRRFEKELDTLAHEPAVRPLVVASHTLVAHVGRPIAANVARVSRPITAQVDRVFRPVAAHTRAAASFINARILQDDVGLRLAVLLTITALGLFAFFGYMVSLLDGDKPVVDKPAANLAADLYSPGVKSVVAVFTYLGAFPVVAVLIFLAVAWLAHRREWRSALALMIGLGLTAGITELVKVTIDRPRPPHSYVSTSGASFPSGHSAYSVALVACTIALTHRLANHRLRAGAVTLAVLVAVLIGFSRVYLRAHYFSDVLAGWGLSAAIFSLCAIGALIAPHVGKGR